MPPVPKKAAAAKKEVAGGSHTITWRDIEFTLPAKLGAEAAWAIADMEAVEKGGGSELGAILSLLDSTLGDQVGKVRAKLRADAVPLDEFGTVAAELLKTIFAAYGMAEGDSAASA